MLVKLFVRNYALIKDLNVEFENGLTIITGETGAGKSILLGALSLILGSRVDTSVLLEKNKKCIVEGKFNIENYDLVDFFASNELDYEPITIVRREINPAGKSRGFINDTPVTINLLKELGYRLIDIHSQHHTLMLRDNAFQLNVIDSFAGTTAMIRKYKQIWYNFRILKKELDEVKETASRNKADIEYYQFQLEQLDNAKLVDGEQEVLEAEQELLSHAEEIKLGLSNASRLFSSEDSSILSMMREVEQSLLKIKDFLPAGGELIKRAESSYIDMNDLAREIEKLAISIEADPHRLAELNARLDIIYSLLHKHKLKNLDELIIKREEIRLKIKSLVSNDERIAELEALVDDDIRLLRTYCDEISEKRKNVLHIVEKKVTNVLKQLGMPDARFTIALSRLKDFTSTGIDYADFLFSANKQIPPENLEKIASGGELSRVMLSLKLMLAKNNDLPTIIFDEIDSGVSGEIADKVGQILAVMGRYMQVINITHLPQIASRGIRHYHVFKDDTGDSTVTKIRLLTHDERVIEVAKLLSGSEITSTAIQNAKELLKAASQ
ncbi:MAG TPA: DNA repair protein RecN [Bacteroidales bacterium]|nr:DNA repair protein RecN [Bacteroidales bacterium]